MSKFYALRSVITVVVMADSPETAKKIAKEELQSLNDDMADHRITEWTDPEIIIEET